MPSSTLKTIAPGRNAISTSGPSASASSALVKARESPLVDKVRLAEGRSIGTPLARANRATISATWTSPASPIGTSTDRADIASAEPESTTRATHAHIPIERLMTDWSPPEPGSFHHHRVPATDAPAAEHGGQDADIPRVPLDDRPEHIRILWQVALAH